MQTNWVLSHDHYGSLYENCTFLYRLGRSSSVDSYDKLHWLTCQLSTPGSSPTPLITPCENMFQCSRTALDFPDLFQNYANHDLKIFFHSASRALMEHIYDFANPIFLFKNSNRIILKQFLDKNWKYSKNVIEQIVMNFVTELWQICDWSVSKHF